MVKATLLLPITLATLLLIPAASAAIPWSTFYEGDGSLSVSGLGSWCRDDARVRAVLVHDDRDGVLHVDAASDGCGSGALALQAHRTGDGWVLGTPDGGLGAGRLYPTPEGWRLEATLTDCPPEMICEFPREVRISALFPGATVLA